MAKTRRDHLYDTLSELGALDLKTFKDKLNNFRPKPGYNRIKWSQLEKAEAVDITRQLVSYYEEDYAVEVAGKVLEAMDKKNLARNLFQATGQGVAEQGDDDDLLRRLEALRGNTDVPGPRVDAPAPEPPL